MAAVNNGFGHNGSSNSNGMIDTIVDEKAEPFDSCTRVTLPLHLEASSGNLCRERQVKVENLPDCGRDDQLHSRPTRESVLKRLYDALMRRSLVKIDLSQRGLRPSDAKLVKLALLQNANLSVLKLGYNQLGDEGVSLLANGVAMHRVLSSLDLGFNHIGDEGCAALAEALVWQSSTSSSTSSLSTLYLAGNLISHQGAMALADAIRYCGLKKLHLTGNSLGPDGVAAITSAMMDHEGICELFLGGTFSGSGGCQSVARLLQHSSSLKVISLANCNINDEDVATLAESIKENRDRLPLEALQLSFNNITCQGLDALTNALWGSRTLRELLLDNNHIGERGGHQLANILPHIKTLQVLDVGFNSIPSSGMRTLMKVVAETQHLVSLSVSGNPIDTSAAKAVAYALAYNRSLTSLFLDHCMIERDGQRHIIAGVVSNSGIMLRKLTGFRIGPVIVSIGLPSALEQWTNEQVLNFMHLMWEQSSQSELDEEAVDPLHFLPNGGDPKLIGPLDASTVVEVAKRAFLSLGDYGESVFMRPHNCHGAFDSPLAEDAIIVEATASTTIIEHTLGHELHGESGASVEENGIPFEQNGLKNGYALEGLPKGPAKSFVATPVESAVVNIPDPARKKQIVDWLCQSIQHLNELAKVPFDPADLWRLHQHYFTPVVKEIGGSLPPRHESRSRIAQSLPDVSHDPTGVSAISLSADSNMDDVLLQSDPALSPPNGVPMLKRKVSYRSLGDAALLAVSKHTPEVRFLSPPVNDTVAKMIHDGPGVNSMPPRTKRMRRNKTRISFLPRIQEKLDSLLDVCHDQALTLMRQLYFVECALLRGDIFSVTLNATHLSGVLASDAEMIVLDMM
ncbi:hypothetical protein MHU86_11995 [Fragilaria crotonensis]|nr:hypothetical protein MHU86_11995 [Fragilaria crotonensis]